MIEGNRIRLRLPEQADDALLVAWCNDPVLKPYFYDDEPVSVESHRRWIERVQADNSQRFYVIEAKVHPDGRPAERPVAIGTTGLLNIDWRNRAAEYGRLKIGDNRYHSGGFGYEAEMLLMRHAFGFLNLNRVWGHVLAYNERVMRLHQRAGFQVDGRLRQAIYKNGCYHDVLVVSLLARDFMDREVENAPDRTAVT